MIDAVLSVPAGVSHWYMTVAAPPGELDCGFVCIGVQCKLWWCFSELLGL